VRAGRFDAGRRDPRVYVRLANTGEPFIRVNLDHNVILRRTGRSDIAARIQQHMTFDIRYLHGFS
jgi:hypothetical protein